MTKKLRYGTERAFLCETAFLHEVDATPVELYPSLERYRREHGCEQPVLEVELRVVRVHPPQHGRVWDKYGESDEGR